MSPQFLLVCPDHKIYMSDIKDNLSICFIFFVKSQLIMFDRISHWHL